MYRQRASTNDRGCPPTTCIYNAATSPSTLPFLPPSSSTTLRNRHKKKTRKTLDHFSQLCLLLLTFVLITMIMAFGALDFFLSYSSYGAYTVLAWLSTEVYYPASDIEAFLLTFASSYIEPHSQFSWSKACRLVQSILPSAIGSMHLWTFLYAPSLASYS